MPKAFSLNKDKILQCVWGWFYWEPSAATGCAMSSEVLEACWSFHQGKSLEEPLVHTPAKLLQLAGGKGTAKWEAVAKPKLDGTD